MFSARHNTMPVFFAVFSTASRMSCCTRGEFTGPSEKAHADIVALNQRHFLPQYSRRRASENPSRFSAGASFPGEAYSVKASIFSRAQVSMVVRCGLRAGRCPPRAADACAVPNGHCVHDDGNVAAATVPGPASQQLRSSAVTGRERWVSYGNRWMRFRRQNGFPGFPFTPQS